MILYLIAVGRVRDTGLRAVCEDYARRARRTVRLEIHDVAEAGRRGGTVAAARRLETERLIATAPEAAFRVALTRRGETLSSLEFAERVRTWRENARDVALLVGGAFGLDPALVDQCDERLALSALTLPHDVARLVLLEQLYRACTILRGEPYHKAERS